jgi:hypothetical protein
MPFSRHGCLAGGRLAAWEVQKLHTVLKVKLPPSAGGRLPVQVWVDPQYWQQTTSLHQGCYVQMAPPTILSCTDLGSVGQIMSITRRNFGNADDCGVKIAGFVCPHPSLREMHSRISCAIPEGKGSKLSVQVCVGGQWSKVGGEAATFSYKGENPATSYCKWRTDTL